MPKNSSASNLEIIEFVRKTTEAITVISESTRSLEGTTGALKEMINVQSVANAKSFEGLTGDNKVLGGKMETLKTIFVAAIVPLVATIAGLVGIKMFFNQP